MSTVRSLLVLITTFLFIGALWYVAYRDSTSGDFARRLVPDTEMRGAYERALNASVRAEISKPPNPSPLT